MRVRVDLHNHSCLSPCADLSMSPRLMAERARAAGIDLMALSDHNSSLNCTAFAVDCARAAVIPLFGMEMNSTEEVHLLAIFHSPRAALCFGARIRDLLPRPLAKAAAFGVQVLVDENEAVLREEEGWLGAALEATFGELAVMASEAGAVVIPAHVDRDMFSVRSQLGFLPEGPYDAVESIGPVTEALSGGLGAMSNSDAHYPDHIGRRPSFVELPDRLVGAMHDGLETFARAWDDAPAPWDSGGWSGDFSYADFIADPRLDLYPEPEAKALFEALRTALRGAEFRPTHVPLFRPTH